MGTVVRGLPLERFELLRTGRILELQDRREELGLTFRIPRRPADDFAASLRMVRVGDLDFGVWCQAQECTFVEPARGDRYHFLFPLRGSARFRVGDTEVDVAASRAAVCLSPNRESGVHHGRGWIDFGISVRREALEETFRCLHGVEPAVPLEFDPRIDLSTDSGGRVERLARYLLRECDAVDGLLHEPTSRETLIESFLVTLLSQLPHTLGDAGGAPADAGRRRVGMAMEYIESRLAHPIRMGEVAEHVGVGLRTLQSAFRRYTGDTPGGFLRRRRLERARERLRADPEARVTDVAMECGMPHLGRFSTEYRRHFGESPSRTRLGASAP